MILYLELSLLGCVIKNKRERGSQAMVLSLTDTKQMVRSCKTLKVPTVKKEKTMDHRFAKRMWQAVEFSQTKERYSLQKMEHLTVLPLKMFNCLQKAFTQLLLFKACLTILKLTLVLRSLYLIWKATANVRVWRASLTFAPLNSTEPSFIAWLSPILFITLMWKPSKPMKTTCKALKKIKL